MDTLIHANIFFFVTTIAVIIFVLLGIIMAVYIIQILRNIKRASDKLEEGIENLSEHAEALSDKITGSFLFTLLFGKRAKKQNKVQ